MDRTLSSGAVHLTVADLERSLATTPTHRHAVSTTTPARPAGRTGRALTSFESTRRGAPAAVEPRAQPRRTPGAHPADLARFVRHYAARDRVPAERPRRRALVLRRRPGRPRIEITCARPREEWRWQDGRPVVVADRCELRDFSTSPARTCRSTAFPGHRMGHVQLKVTDPGLTDTEPFYCDLLGFNVEGRLGTMFLAVGVTRYRGELVLTNRFSPDGGEPAPRALPGSSGSTWCCPTPTTWRPWPTGSPPPPTRTTHRGHADRPRPVGQPPAFHRERPSLVVNSRSEAHSSPRPGT